MFKMWIMPSFASQRCFKPFWAYSSEGGYFFVHRQPVDLPTTKKLKGMTDSPTNVLESLSFHLYRFWYSMPACFLTFDSTHNTPRLRRNFNFRMWEDNMETRSPSQSCAWERNQVHFTPWRKTVLFSSRSWFFASKKSSRDQSLHRFWDTHPSVVTRMSCSMEGFSTTIYSFSYLVCREILAHRFRTPKKTSCPRQRTQGFSCLRHG